jgi:hypothetical protein
MSGLTSILLMSLRAAVWRKTSDPPAIGLAGLTVWSALSLMTGLIAQYVVAGDDRYFDFYGINSSMAELALLVLVSAFFLPAQKRLTALCAMLALGIPVSVAFIWLQPRVSDATYGWLWLLQMAWAAGAVFAILRSVSTSSRLRALGATLGMSVTTLLAFQVLPLQPVFTGRDFKMANANNWERVRAALLRSQEDEESESPAIDAARTQLSQPALLDLAIAGLAPQRAGTTDLYAIGIAGWGSQDVFIRELEGGLDVMAKSLPIDQRTLRLINHHSTVDHTPVATLQNFATAIRGMASHGARKGLALRLRDLTYDTLTPEDVATVLDREGIKNRILVISACFAGVFIPPLANENTIVLTAADKSSPSFGCSNEREWTYFGDALFNNALRDDKDLLRAFAKAKALIDEWERRDGLSASNPQVHIGRALAEKLSRLQAAAAVQ